MKKKKIDDNYKYSDKYDDAVELFLFSVDEIEKALEGMKVLHLTHLMEMLGVILTEQKKAAYHQGFIAGKNFVIKNTFLLKVCEKLLIFPHF